HACLVSTASSSPNSRISADSGVSPGSTLPPGNSHRPARALPSGRWAMSTRRSASTKAQATTSSRGLEGADDPEAGTGSAPVVAVDGDIAIGEVAGIDRRFARAEAEADGQVQLLAFHIGAGGGLVVALGTFAVLGDGEIAEADGEAVAVGRLARLAHGHDHAAPIGVLAGDGGLHEGAVGNGLGDAEGAFVRNGALDMDRDLLGRAFPVADHLDGQLEQHVGKGLAEDFRAWIVE